jgi:hypothetical protein
MSDKFSWHFGLIDLQIAWPDSPTKIKGRGGGAKKKKKWKKKFQNFWLMTTFKGDKKEQNMNARTWFWRIE